MLAQLLWVLAGIITTAYDPDDLSFSIYDISTEAEVVEFHDVVSSDKFRIVMEVYAAMYWISFPFLLVGIYGLQKILYSIFVGTEMEMWVYVLEKAYLLSVVVTNIIGPALALVIVSFEWSIHLYTPEADYIPSGYYIQLYAMTFVYELYDSVGVADGLFLLLASLTPQFEYCTKDPKYNVLKNHGSAKKAYQCCMTLGAITIAIIYAIAVFRFANHGFFSLAGGASFLVIYGYIIKFFIGLRLFLLGYGNRYDELDRVFGQKTENDDKMINNDGNASPYAMDTINTNNNKNEEEEDANL